MCPPANGRFDIAYLMRERNNLVTFPWRGRGTAAGFPNTSEVSIWGSCVVGDEGWQSNLKFLHLDFRTSNQTSPPHQSRFARQLPLPLGPPAKSQISWGEGAGEANWIIRRSATFSAGEGLWANAVRPYGSDQRAVGDGALRLRGASRKPPPLGEVAHEV